MMTGKLIFVVDIRGHSEYISGGGGFQEGTQILPFIIPEEVGGTLL